MSSIPLPLGRHLRSQSLHRRKSFPEHPQPGHLPWVLFACATLASRFRRDLTNLVARLNGLVAVRCYTSGGLCTSVCASISARGALRGLNAIIETWIFPFGDDDVVTYTLLLERRKTQAKAMS